MRLSVKIGVEHFVYNIVLFVKSADQFSY